MPGSLQRSEQHFGFLFIALVWTIQNTCKEHFDLVTSQDGMTIGYRQMGQSPGVVVLHGATESSQSYRQLAEALVDSFTTYLLGRRGRGMSGSHGAEYSIQKEVEDLDALLTKTGAHQVFGVLNCCYFSWYMIYFPQ